MSPRVVILSAGASARLGEPKALAEIGGRAVLDWMLSAALNASPGGAPPLVVTGAHHMEISDFLTRAMARPSNRLRFEIARNDRWSEGRTAGLQLAAQRCPGTDLLIWPADVPLVSAGTLRALFQEWDHIGSPHRGWLAPAVGKSFLASEGPPGRAPRGAQGFGHPILVGAKLLRELEGMGAATPLRRLRELAEPLAALAVDDRAVLDDLDTPADLERLRRRVHRHDA